ncbi:MAG: hypothetical protein AAF170_13130 [Bacteroidota bacterium]
MANHESDDIKPRKGFFRKHGDGQELNYETEWKNAGKKGYGSLIYQVHHILPEDSIYNKAVLKISNADKRTFVEKCLYKTPWNINAPVNLIGLPDLYSFLIYFDRKKGNSQADKVSADGKSSDASGYIKNKISRLNQRSKNPDDYIDLKSLFGDLGKAGSSPEHYPVHLPVSWGHTRYNYAVADDIKSNVIDPLNAIADQHKIVFENVASIFDALASTWEAYLISRAATATYDTWQLRYTTPPTPEATWRTPFTMHDASSTISTT